MIAKSGLANVHAVYAVYRRFKARRQQGARLPMIEERDNTDERSAHLKHSIKGDRSVTQRQEVTNPHADLRAVLDDVLPLRARALVRDLLEERDKLAEQIEDQDDAPEWLSAVDEALGEDRNKAPFIDDAVRLLRKERDALKAEVERLRAAKPAESATIKEKLNEIIARDRIELAKAEAAADAAWRERLLAFEEHRMRCMMAATVLPILAQWGKEHGIEGPFRDAVVNEAHHYADALIAEARRRKEAGK